MNALPRQHGRQRLTGVRAKRDNTFWRIGSNHPSARAATLAESRASRGAASFYGGSGGASAAAADLLASTTAVARTRQIQAGVEAINGSLARAQRLFLAYQAAQSLALSVGSVATRADEYGNYLARLQLATRGAAEFAAAQGDIGRIAILAQAPVAELATLYARMAGPIRDMGRAARDTSAVAETMALSLKISGATTAEQAATIGQACFQPAMIKSTNGPGCFAKCLEAPHLRLNRKPRKPKAANQ